MKAQMLWCQQNLHFLEEDRSNLSRRVKGKVGLSRGNYEPANSRTGLLTFALAAKLNCFHVIRYLICFINNCINELHTCFCDLMSPLHIPDFPLLLEKYFLQSRLLFLCLNEGYHLWAAYIDYMNVSISAIIFIGAHCWPGKVLAIMWVELVLLTQYSLLSSSCDASRASFCSSKSCYKLASIGGKKKWMH